MPASRRWQDALQSLRRNLPVLAFAAAIVVIWSVRDARENALLQSAIVVSPDKQVTLLSTSW